MPVSSSNSNNSSTSGGGSGGAGVGGRRRRSSNGSSSRRQNVSLPSSSIFPQTVVPSEPPMASLALKLTRQEWNRLSLDSNDSTTCETAKLEVLVERITAILLIRIVACVATPGMFPDLSTTMICMTSISRKKASWPPQISIDVIQQLFVFVQRIMSGYKNVPYHNREHAYHVILSVNKLLDMVVCCYTNLNEPNKLPKKFRPPPSFGLRNDPLAMFALVFAALIHDVEHQGIPNRQLAAENDRLAVLYNDQSIAENWSLYIAFSELLQDEFVDLRKALFGPDLESASHSEQYHNFRKMVINMVLSTDIASPERTQVVKSKWKEAFGDPHETVEAKYLSRSNRDLRQLSNYSGHSLTNSTDSSVGIVAVDSSSEFNLDESSSRNLIGQNSNSNNSSLQGRQIARRMTQESAVSDMTNTIGRRSSGETASDGYDENESYPNINSLSFLHNAGGFTSLREVDQDSQSITPQNSQSGDNFVGLTRTEEGQPQKSHQTQPELPPEEEKNAIEKHQLVQKQGSYGLSSLSDHHISSSASLTAASDHLRYMSSNGSNSVTDEKTRSSLNQFLSKSHHRFESRLSRSGSMAHGSKQYRQRLGILRTVDLGGETLQTYSRHDNRHSSSQSTVAFSVADTEQDEPDELKMTVVMETMLAAADVAHNLQSWSHMLAWSKRLYMELRSAHVTGRGVDVSSNWFENQIGFLESYVLPLARRLEDTGVFGDETTPPGISFAERVEQLRDEWIANGYDFSQEIIDEGAQKIPMGGDTFSVKVRSSNSNSSSASNASGNKSKKSHVKQNHDDANMQASPHENES